MFIEAERVRKRGGTMVRNEVLDSNPHTFPDRGLHPQAIPETLQGGIERVEHKAVEASGRHNLPTPHTR